ncbi:hypothetical protein M8C21_020536, partial [Ambrosia artemisiifolia]
LPGVLNLAAAANDGGGFKVINVRDDGDGEHDSILSFATISSETTGDFGLTPFRPSEVSVDRPWCGGGTMGKQLRTNLAKRAAHEAKDARTAATIVIDLNKIIVTIVV